MRSTAGHSRRGSAAGTLTVASRRPITGANAPADCSGKACRDRSLDMDNPYLEVISYVERLHRQFLEVVKLELEGLEVHDINNVQAMMLFNIGDAEMTVGELTLRGCYLGSNVSYNVKKMVENEYL